MANQNNRGEIMEMTLVAKQNISIKKRRCESLRADCIDIFVDGNQIQVWSYDRDNVKTEGVQK